MGIFVSHIDEEAKLAAALKDVLESILEGPPEIFVSSEPGAIRGGAKWLDVLQESLKSSDVVIVLCSPLSIMHQWIHFEVGAAWMRRATVLPICHSGMDIAKVGPPLSEHHSLVLEEPSFISSLVVALLSHFSISSGLPDDHSSLHKALLDAIPHSPVDFLELLDDGKHKIQVIKLAREFTGLGLKEAKQLVDSPPR